MPRLWSSLADEAVLKTLSETLPFVARELANRVESLLPRTKALEKVGVFENQSMPDLSLSDYCSRLAKYLPVCPSAFVLAAVYLDTYGQTYAITSNNKHRLVLASLVLAYCHLEDLVYENKYLARVGGVEPKELARLEIWMLAKLKHQLTVNRSTFMEYFMNMTRDSGRKDHSRQRLG